MKKQKAKIVLLGDSYVGKTSIALRFSKDEFKATTESTIGALYFTHIIEENNVKYQFDIWDTAGQERFQSLGVLYYKNAKAALIIFDVTKQNSFERAKFWVSELNENADADIIIALVGNKIDKEDQREISEEEARDFAESNGLLYFQCSAKSGENVKQLFLEIMRHVPFNQNQGQLNDSIIQGEDLNVQKNEDSNSYQSKCC